MKFLIALVAVVALVSAADEKKPAADEKPREDKPHLVWPLPDVLSEGDLMLHGRISFDRVRDLHKAKLEEDVDKMILAHGRLFLRRVSKFFDDNADLKIMPILCRDSRNLNGTHNRWRIEIPKEIPQAAAPVDAPAKPAQGGPIQRDAPLPKDKADKVDEPRNNLTLSNETEAPTTVAPSSEKPTDKPSTDKPTEKPSGASTTLKPEIEKPEDKDSYEVRRRDFYRRVGENFARLLMKEYRKETMVQEETEYLARWIADEAVHYGAMAIYCNENENVKEIKKNLAVYLEEKSQ
jgi:hypothetical protein